MTLLGIDGCRCGWCVASFFDNEINVKVHSTIQEISDHSPDVDLALIDIPLGLGDQKISRDLDGLARKHLIPGRSSSIFIPPVRESLLVENYDKAKHINYQITGKRISMQTWNITSKIRELDDFVNLNPAYSKLFKEAHPEICFKYLNLGKLPMFRKRATQNRGIEERLKILERFDHRIEKAYVNARKQYPKSIVANDDIVDALCLLITAILGRRYGFSIISGKNKKDSKGIEMGMYYYNPQLN